MRVHQHRSTCACGWKGPWRVFWPIAWLDYYTRHRWDRSDRYWNRPGEVHRQVTTA